MLELYTNKIIVLSSKNINSLFYNGLTELKLNFSVLET